MFPDTLRRGVEGCVALLALIGPEWLDVRDDDGGRRLDAADDFVRREIALALEQGKKVIPVLFDDAPVPPRDRLPDPLKALASCNSLPMRGQTYEYQTQRRELVRLLAKVPGVPQPLPEVGSSIFPDDRDIRVVPPLSPPTPSDRRDLLILLDRVEHYWVKGVLDQSVQHEALINLGKETKADAVQHPWEQVLELPDAASKPLPADTRITEVFEDVGRLLLIIGDPGSGKTMTLLDLARNLIGRARSDACQPVPVVFPLNSWNEEFKTLSDWLTEKLKTEYLIPKRFGRRWLNDSRIMPLLDGLDEVQADRRAACIRAINSFLEEHGTQGIAVCSRLQEYMATPVRVKMRGAICLQPLTPEQADCYLAHFGPEVEGLRTALKKDHALQELARSPLMLDTMTLAYQGASTDDPIREANEAGEARYARIFETYVSKMFKTKGKVVSNAYPTTQTKRWLSWLAHNMKSQSLAIFVVALVQPICLKTTTKLFLYCSLSRLSALVCLYSLLSLESFGHFLFMGRSLTGFFSVSSPDTLFTIAFSVGIFL